MAEFLFLMHDDTTSPVDSAAWPAYFAQLGARFQGGSSIGSGVTVRRDVDPPVLTAHLAGYIKVVAADLHEARGLVPGNPVYEAGGTVEVRELPRD